MANRFTLTILANANQATAVVRSFNKTVSKIVSPVTNVHSSFKSLNKEIAQNPLVKGAGKLGQGIGKVFGQVGKFIPELGEIGGMAGEIAGVAGAFGLVGGAAVAALVGIAAIDMKFAGLGFTLRQTSISLGMSTQAVQGWHGAAGLMGIDAKAVDASFQQLGDTIQDATMGRNQQAVLFMNRLGVSLKRTKTGAIDVNDEMLQLADVIKKYNGNPETQRLIARQFGVEAMLPALRLGRKEMAGYLQDQKKWALSDKEIEDANKFHLALAKAGAVMKGFTVKVFSKIFDISLWALRGLRDGFGGLTDFVGGVWNSMVALFTGGIEKIKTLVDKVKEVPGKVVNKVKQVTGDVVHGAADTFAKFTGLGGAKQISAFFQKNGFSGAQANGIVAGMFAESHLNAGARNPTSGAFGLGQWLGSRKTDFAKLFGHDLKTSTMDEQLRFMLWEFKNKEGRAGRAIGGAGSSAEALDAYVRRYMRPAAGMETTGDLARGSALLALLSAQGAGGGANGVRPGGGSVDVNVKVQHDGRSATVKTASAGAATVRPPRVERSLTAVPA